MGSSGLGTDDERWAAGNGGGQWQRDLICGRWPGATAPASGGRAASRALPCTQWRPSPALIRRLRPSSTRIRRWATATWPGAAAGLRASRGGRSRWKAATTTIAGDDDGDDGDHEEGDG